MAIFKGDPLKIGHFLIILIKMIKIDLVDHRSAILIIL